MKLQTRNFLIDTLGHIIYLSIIDAEHTADERRQMNMTYRINALRTHLFMLTNDGRYSDDAAHEQRIADCTEKLREAEAEHARQVEVDARNYVRDMQVAI